MSKSAIQILGLWVACLGVGVTADAQLVLPPKPEKEVPIQQPKQDDAQVPRSFIGSIPAKGWHFETGLGVAIWGIDSQCGCNALTADIGFYYVNRSGLLIGSQLTLTNTVASSVTPSFKIGYQAVKKDGSIGLWSVNLLAGPSIGNVNQNRSINSDKYSGYLYGGELSFQPRLGKYSQLRGIIGLGWLTQKESFNSDGWRGPTETKMTHSGVRIRFGITI